MCSENHFQKVTMVVITILIFRVEVSAQPALTVYTDFAQNSVSDGLFIRSAFLGFYKSRDYQLKVGLQTNLLNNNSVVFSGYRIDGSREFKIKNNLLGIHGFFMWTSASRILQQTNYGCAFTLNRPHFDMLIGTNFRTYSFRRNAFKIFEIGDDATKLHENFNLMYSFAYNLKPSDNKWNVSVNLTNIDYFMINQETNPYVNLKAYYKVSSKVLLFTGLWYKNAGVANICSNYFGYIMRGGVQWEFN